MRCYLMRCPRCEWRTPMPVSERVKDAMGPICLNCKAVGIEQKFEIKEQIKVGPVQFLPHKDEG